MSDMIIYRPHRSSGWIVPFMAGVCILSFVGVGFCLPEVGQPLFFFALMGILSAWVTKWNYDLSNIVVCFRTAGLYISGGKYKNHRILSWTELSHAYYARNFKAQLLLILSPETLAPKEVKRLVRRSVLYPSKICIDSAAVIPLYILQDTEPLKKWVADHVSQVESC